MYSKYSEIQQTTIKSKLKEIASFGNYDVCLPQVATYIRGSQKSKHFVAILENNAVTEGVGCTLSSDKMATPYVYRY